MRSYSLPRVLKFGLFAIAAVAVGGWVVMALWNGLMPGIFALHAISFWQALGLLVLSKILFGGLGPHRGGGPRWRGRMMERWEQMTPEQRQRFKQGMRGGCGPRRDVDAPGREAEAQA